MRRRLHRFLPVALLALVIQILAPIGAGWAAALAISDPAGAFTICHDGGSVPADPDQSNDNGHDNGCPICCMLHSDASLAAPRILALAIVHYRIVVDILGGYETPQFVAARIGSNFLARGPPQAI
jgi:hypothetical protein